MSGKPIMLPQRHAINIALATILVVLIAIFIATESHTVFWLITIVALVLGVLLIVPIGARHAGRRLDAELLFGLGAAGIGFTLATSRSSSRVRWWAPRCDPQLYHVQGHEPQLHLGHPRGFGGETAAASVPRKSAGEAGFGG